MKLTRSRRGNLYHRPDCRHADPAMVWIWAADKTVDEVAASARNGVIPCSVCKPLASDTARQPHWTELVARYTDTEKENQR